MQKEGLHLLRFVESSRAFDNNCKLKLALFLSGIKPATYVHLKITDNLHDKHEFERLLRLNGFPFEVSRPKGFEEIVGINGSKVVWRFKGTWHGYDLFQSRKQQAQFHEYVSLIRQRNHRKADVLGGKLYGYPSCCVQAFIKRHDLKKLAKYSYYEFYNMLHDMDRVFPFIAHTPCSAKCRQTILLNANYKALVKKNAPVFFKEYSGRRVHRVNLIIDAENDIGAWKKKDGFDYSVITDKPVEGHYLVVSWLSRKQYERGTVLSATLTLQYDYALVKPGRVVRVIKDLHHERKFSG